MEYFIKLKRNLGYVQKPQPFYVTDGEKLTIVCDCEENLSNCIVECANGTVKTRAREDLTKPFVIDDSLLVGGELNIAVNVVLKGIIARRIAIEPIVVVEDINGVYAFPEMKLMEQQIYSLSTLLAQHNDKIAEMENTIDKIHSALEQ